MKHIKLYEQFLNEKNTYKRIKEIYAEIKELKKRKSKLSYMKPTERSKWYSLEDEIDTLYNELETLSIWIK